MQTLPVNVVIAAISVFYPDTYDFITSRETKETKESFDALSWIGVYGKLQFTKLDKY